MKKFSVIFLFCFLLLPANASDWVLAPNNSFMVDKESLVKDGDTVKAWIMRDEKGKFEGKKYIYSQTYMQVDCNKKTLSNLYIGYYGKKGKSIVSTDLEALDMVTKNRVIPDTVGEYTLNFLCEM